MVEVEILADSPAPQRTIWIRKGLIARRKRITYHSKDDLEEEEGLSLGKNGV